MLMFFILRFAVSFVNLLQRIGLIIKLDLKRKHNLFIGIIVRVLQYFLITF